MKIENGVIRLDVTVDEVKNKVVVFVEMAARQGRNPVVRCRPSTVRDMLSENGVDVAELISGHAIHNSMSRRLGQRTEKDLTTTMVFSLPSAVEQKAPEPAKAKKTTRKATKTQTRARATKTVVEQDKLEQPKGEAPGVAKEVSKPVTAKKTSKTTATTRTRRSKAKTTTKK